MKISLDHLPKCVLTGGTYVTFAVGRAIPNPISVDSQFDDMPQLGSHYPIRNALCLTQLY